VAAYHQAVRPISLAQIQQISVKPNILISGSQQESPAGPQGNEHGHFPIWFYRAGSLGVSPLPQIRCVAELQAILDV
jgi:hypothetical protein